MMKIPFEQVVTEHGATVLRVCRATLGAGPDAEDAWSDTFLAAFVAWPDLAPAANVQAWLVRIAQRKTIDIVRRRARRPAPVDSLPADAVPVGGAALAQVPAEDDGAELWAAVAALPERQRLAIAYHYFGGLTHVETAELIGGSPESVRRAATDGIRNLRSRLTGLHNTTKGADRS